MKLHSIPNDTDRLNIPISFVTGAKSNKIIRLGTFSEALNLMRFDEKVKEFGGRLKELRETDKIEYDKIKTSKCPGFVIGKYNERKDSSCEVYVPLVGFDIDKFENEVVAKIYLERCKECPYIFTAFLSPSMRGLRIFIWCDSTPVTHKDFYKKITTYLSTFLQIPTDKSISKDLKENGENREEIKAYLELNQHIDTGTSNISRIWFYSHVPEDSFYLNNTSDIFEANLSEPQEKLTRKFYRENTKSLTWTEKVETIESIVEERYKGGSRNERLFMLTCLMFEYGIIKSDILNYCKRYKEKDFNLQEISATINSAEKRSEHSKYTDENLINYLDKKNRQQKEIRLSNKSTNAKIDNAEEVDDGKVNGVRKSKFSQIKEYLFSKYRFRLNVLSNEIEYNCEDFEEWQILNENDLVVELYENGFNAVEKMLLALLRSSHVPKHDPIIDYFESLPSWDKSQPDYITMLASYVDAKDQKWFNLQLKKMLVRSIACATNKIPFNKHCFVLHGKQHNGKTSFLRFLCPPLLKKYYKENVDVRNKDGRLALSQNIFINLDELAAIEKQDINRIKAWFTYEKIKDRLPYGKREISFPRRASFLASTNELEFLTDKTGNVRWLIFEINKIHHDKGGVKGYAKNIDINLVYSQAYALLQSGFNYKLTSRELAKSERNNRKFQVVSMEEELIQERFLPAEKDQEGTEFMTTTKIHNEIEKVTRTRITIKAVGVALRSLGFKQEQEYNSKKKYQEKGYFILRVLEDNE